MNGLATTSGYVPGGEDRPQWIFEGDWTDEMKQPLIDVVTRFVEAYRARYQDDNVNWFRFSYADITPDLRRYYVSRRSWRFSLQAPTPEELAQEVTEHIEKYVMRG